MKFDSGRMIIWCTGLWLYTVLVVTLSEFGDIPIAIAFLSYIPICVLYVWMLSRENKKLSPEELATRKPQGALGIRHREMGKRDWIEAVIAVFGSAILAILTVAYVTRPDMGVELTESIKLSRITCQRDESKITTLPVNKTVEADGTKITVHNVTYNVPGQDEHPVEFPGRYHCAKATLVEVTVDRPKAIKHKGSQGIYLQQGNEKDSPSYYNSDDWSNYLNKKGLFVLNDYDFTYKNDAYQKRGWLLFRLPEEHSNTNNTIVYSVNNYDSGDRHKMSVPLPSPGK